MTSLKKHIVFVLFFGSILSFLWCFLMFNGMPRTGAIVMVLWGVPAIFYLTWFFVKGEP